MLLLGEGLCTCSSPGDDSPHQNRESLRKRALLCSICQFHSQITVLLALLQTAI